MYRLTLCLLFVCQAVFAQVNVVADHANALYSVGESMNFLISSNQDGPVSYSIYYDRFANVLASGTVELAAGDTIAIPFTGTEPSIVYCHATQNWQKGFAAAAFDPFDIPAIGQAPADLNAYWQSQKEELVQIPLDSQLELFETHPYSKTYRISLAALDDRRVYGLLSIPDTMENLPAVLTLPPFGNVPSVVTPEYILAERLGALSLTISIHNVPTDETDPIGYDQGDSADPDSIYYRYAITGAMRAIDYIESRPDFNGYLIVNGVSQGGGLSMLIAGIDDRVDLMAQSNAALCQHQGILENKASGFPYYIFNSRFEVGTEEHEAATIEAVKYYDAVYTNRNIDFPTYHIISYEDTITPSATVFAAYNQIIAPKVLLHAKALGHSHPDEYFSRRREFYRQHMPSPIFPTWPFPDNTTGYFVDAGENMDVPHADNSFTLNATVKLHDVDQPDFPSTWEMIDGPTPLSFSNFDGYSVTVNFENAGEYLFRFTAYDGYEEQADKLFTVQDYVKVTVLEPLNTANVFIQNTKLFPNPTSNNTRLILPEATTGAIQLYHTDGKLVRDYPTQRWSAETNFDFSDLPTGLYYLNFSNDEMTFMKKVVKR